MEDLASNNVIVAFVVGVIVPVLVALFGREPIGKLLLGRERREDTALSALICLATESVAGWRESNVAVMQLSESMRERNNDNVAYRDRSTAERGNIFATMEQMNGRLKNVEGLLGDLVRLLAGDLTEVKANEKTVGTS